LAARQIPGCRDAAPHRKAAAQSYSIFLERITTFVSIIIEIVSGNLRNQNINKKSMPPVTMTGGID
jgi:hypothetical protein